MDVSPEKVGRRKGNPRVLPQGPQGPSCVSHTRVYVSGEYPNTRGFLTFGDTLRLDLTDGKVTTPLTPSLKGTGRFVQPRFQVGK